MNTLRFLLFSFLSVSLSATAQRQNLYFLKNNGSYVKLRDSADYLRIVKEPEEGSKLYVVNEHYLDGTTKSMGYSSKIDPPRYEDQYISYYKNGSKKMIGFYRNGKLVDTAYHYYPNGNLYTITGYGVNGDGKGPAFIKTVKDSIGKDLVVDGNGDAVFYDTGFKYVTEHGKIKNGLYDGEWIGGSSLGSMTYKETYVDGKMISGESTDKNGAVYSYIKARVDPQFKNGMDAFYTYLRKTIRYPEQCYRSGIQGKVLVSFTVMKDGSLENIRVMNEVHPALATEAVRVIKDSPAWEPGVLRGKPANVVYNVPVSFTLRR